MKRIFGADLSLDPEGGGTIVMRNIGKLLPDSTALYPEASTLHSHSGQNLKTDKGFLFPCRPTGIESGTSRKLPTIATNNEIKY
jgi:hypothetical protein